MIGVHMGRLFEIGFNAGLLHYLHRSKLNPELVEYYRQDLQHLSLNRMVRAILEDQQVVNETARQIVEKWSSFFLARGFLAGINFLPEYLEAVGWHKRPERLKLLYFQASFSGDNSLHTYPKSQEQFAREMLNQFGEKTAQLATLGIKHYLEKGEFLKADTLLLLSYRGRGYRVISLDLSVFSLRALKDLTDLEDVTLLRSQLLREIAYLKSKSVFANLSLDTAGLEFHSELARFFTAFKREDKETSKLIQAASYAASFAEFLEKYQILDPARLQPQEPLIFNVVGYTDRGLNAMAISQENLPFLKKCAQIYKRQSKDQEIGEARRQVLQVIKRNTARSFEEGHQFVESLLQLPVGQSTQIVHQEQITGFYNIESVLPPTLLEELGLNCAPTITSRNPTSAQTNRSGVVLRQGHEMLIAQALEELKLTYLFLTGNPGIGKTTSIVKFLHKHQDEGYLFIYASPRKQVNLDIVQKFRDKTTGRLVDDRLIAINTNSIIIDNNNGAYTVQYISNHRQDDFTLQGVQFLNAERPEEEAFSSSPSSVKGLRRTMEDLIEDQSTRTAGVLNSIFEALNSLISSKEQRNIVATTTLQALKKLNEGEDTLTRHFEKIFKSAYNRQKGEVIASKMREIAGRTKHLFIMVDEITGDDSGVEFLNRLGQLLQQYELLDGKHGFNTKIIVADASIVDPDIITQHISDSSFEPDKIFFRRLPQNRTGQPLSKTAFTFKGLPSLVINANSYPASHLTLTYKVFVESSKYDLKLALERRRNFINALQGQLVVDIHQLYNQAETGQILVYIQDKRRLAELIATLAELNPDRFEENRDYLQIHSNLSENQKKEVHQYIEQVKVVFMTASASRGLSFPKAKHILVDIPSFDLESNLMEIIQVIYRGRGNFWDEERGVEHNFDNEAKNLTFYLAGQSIYYGDDPDEPALSLQESSLNLLNVLLLLKTSIMTRIKGCGQVGRDQVLVIPIGAKSVSAAGETFTSRMVKLIDELEKQYYRSHRSDKGLQELYLSLRNLLGSAQISLSQRQDGQNWQPPGVEGQSYQSYMSLRKTFAEEFRKATLTSFEKLLELKSPELGYIQGSMLIVPLKDKRMHENYLMQLAQQLKEWSQDSTLLNRMVAISKDAKYPEDLRVAMYGAIQLIRLLQHRNGRTQLLEMRSQRDDQYYAVPLFSLISPVALEEYFAGNPEEPEDFEFKTLLYQYIRSLYPVDGLLPVGSKYTQFPFIMFKSYSLREARSKIFTDKYLVSSRELNVLNLILAEN